MSKKRKRREQARLKELKKKGLLKESEEEQPTRHAHTHHTSHAPKKQEGLLGSIKYIYEHHYKTLLWIPFIILLLAFAQIGYQTATTGDFINKGVSLKGGATLTIPGTGEVNIDALETSLTSKFPDYDIAIRTLTAAGSVDGLIIDADLTDQDQIDAFAESVASETGVAKEIFGIESVGSSLGESFFKETIISLLLAFLFMAGVVFLYFRIPAPSAAVVLAAVSDIVVTVAVINMMGMKISTAGIAALLMLVGYSVDTDILLSTRVLKRKEGTVLDGVYNAMKTGMTMTLTTLVAVSVGFFVSQSEVLKQIMAIVLIGLVIDVINTWIQNAGLLRWYLEYADKKKATRMEAKQ